jgi:hypothetical protein
MLVLDSSRKDRINRSVGSCSKRADQVGKTCLWVVPLNGTVEAGQEVKLKVVLYLDEVASRRMTLGEDDANGESLLRAELISRCIGTTGTPREGYCQFTERSCFIANS